MQNFDVTEKSRFMGGEVMTAKKSERKKLYLIFCPCCGSEKVVQENFRLSCYNCESIFGITELKNLRVFPRGYKP